MTLSRIRTDRSLRSLPIWAIAALINSSVLLGIVFLQRATQGAGSIPTTSLLLVCRTKKCFCAFSLLLISFASLSGASLLLFPSIG